MYHIEGRADTDEKKQQFLDRFYQLWVQHPQYYLRFGQLLLNVFRDNSFYYLEDEDLLKELENFYKKDKM